MWPQIEKNMHALGEVEAKVTFGFILAGHLNFETLNRIAMCSASIVFRA